MPHKATVRVTNPKRVGNENHLPDDPAPEDHAGLKAGRRLGINFGFPERRFSLFMGLQ
jgi:hypothetical protein